MNYTKALSVVFTFTVLAGVVWQGLSCTAGRTDNMSAEKKENLPTGIWGGEHIIMQVSDKGATLEFDCAHGAIDKKIVLDSNGRFDIKGTFVAEQGGPVTPGQADKEHPARYAGRVDGKTMTLTITLTDKNENIGAFTLTHGKMSMLTKCY